MWGLPVGDTVGGVGAGEGGNVEWVSSTILFKAHKNVESFQSVTESQLATKAGQVRDGEPVRWRTVELRRPPPRPKNIRVN